MQMKTGQVLSKAGLLNLLRCIEILCLRGKGKYYLVSLVSISKNHY